MNDQLMPDDWPFDADAAAVVSIERAVLCPVLAANGIATVTIAYDGYGDEGQIETITALDADGVERPLPEAACPPPNTRSDAEDAGRERTVAQVLDDLGYDVLAACFAGWENNESALGTVTLDVASGRITIEHDWRVTALERAERVL